MMTSNNHKLAVLLISNLFSVGDNYGGICKELAEKLLQQGWDVSITSTSPFRLLRPFDMLTAIWRKRRNYSVAQIDVFSGSAFRWAEASVFALKRLQKPFILTLRGGNLPNFGGVYRDRVRALLDSAEIVTTPSRYLLDAMQDFKSDIKLVPNPINIQLYQFRLRSPAAPRILFLRALHKIYNPVLAVEALKVLHQTRPNAKLMIVGPDKGDGSANDVRLAVNATGLSNYVEIIGAIHKTEVPQTMDRADIFINTSNIDNTPISVLEAMACGMCIVSTNVGGIPYLLEHGHDALLVPPNDHVAMAHAINRILTEPSLAEHLSQNARVKAEQFAWSTILPQWETLLIDAIEQYHHV